MESTTTKKSRAHSPFSRILKETSLKQRFPIISPSSIKLHDVEFSRVIRERSSADLSIARDKRCQGENDN